MDAILVAAECVDVRNNSTVPGILCKLDIEKAYDHPNREYMCRTLRRMGFGNTWINWVKFCMSTVKFSREPRQGDPLSPFLFILNMGRLNDLLKTAQQNNRIKGFKVNEKDPRGVSISHLRYVDDTLVFCDAKCDQCGRVTLINSALSAIPTYMMSLFPISGKILKKLDATKRKFLWQVGLWRTIRNQWQKIWSNFVIKGGNGNKTLFWDDVWVGRTPLKQQYPDMHSLNHIHGWNQTFRRFLNDWGVDSLIQFYNSLKQPKSLTSEEDRLMWKLDKEGKFKVRSAYKIYGNSSQIKKDWPWKMIWKGKIPHKVSCFIWLVARQAVLTQDKLVRRGKQLCSRCFYVKLRQR
ncbi:unnamed protein product [Withania somnifera]